MRKMLTLAALLVSLGSCVATPAVAGSRRGGPELFDFFFFVLVGRPPHWWEWLIIGVVLFAAVVYLLYWLLDTFGGMDP